MLHSHRTTPFRALVFAFTAVSTGCGPASAPDDNGPAATGGFVAVGGAAVGGGLSGGAGGVGGGAGTLGGGPSASGANTSTGGSPSSGGAPGGGTGTGGSPSDGGQGAGGAAKAATWEDITYMLNGSCASCHGPTAKINLAPDETPGATNAAVYRSMTTYKVPECGNSLLVSPGHPEDSAFLKLLNLECTKDGEPFIMPQSCGIAPCFPEDWMQSIALWIEGGAVGP